MQSIDTFLSGIVDYAGLFPPAQLGMEEAVRNYASYLSTKDHVMLGRFVVPVSRLDEFEAIAEPFFSRPGGSSWIVTALLGNNVEADMQRLGKLNCKHYQYFGRSIVDSVELKADTKEKVEAAARAIPYVFHAYFESPTELIPAIKAAGQRGKIRTGGITPDAFPPARDIAQFIIACHGNNLAFKATAGLHHPLRAVYRLTYEPDSVKGMMYGYLNVFLTAAMVRFGMQEDEAVALLEESDPGAIRFSNDGVTWKSHKLTSQQLAEARTNFAIAFGSCSYREPVDEIKELIK